MLTILLFAHFMYIDSLFIYIYVTVSDIFGLVKLKVGNFDLNMFTFFERIFKKLK